MNGDDSGDENSLKGFYSYKNTFEDDAIWLDIPKNVTFINTTNPYLDPATPDFETMSVASMDSPAPFQPRSGNSWPTSGTIHSMTSTPSMGSDLSIPMCYTPELDALPPLMQSPPTSTVNTPISPPASLCNRRIHPIMDWSGTMTPPPIDPRLTSPFDSVAEYMPRSCSMSSSRQSPPRSNGESLMSKDHEVAFLLRHFSEGPGRWMDLFDRDTYFASYVPIQARENALLKNAAVACAAKALAQVQGCKSGGSRCHARAEIYPGSSSVDWKHKAAIYYDNAVSLLLQALKSDTTITPDDSDCEFRQRNGQLEHPAKRRRTSSNASCASSTDELLAASAILCVYEFLDTSMSEWAKHLNGAKSLLVHSQERLLPTQMQSPGSPISISSLKFTSKARRSIFWNIARQDMHAAFINKSHTHLDTEDLSLWKEAGLLIDDQGFLVPNNLIESDYFDDGAICNSLIWLTSKLINFMAAGDEVPDEGMGWTGIPQSTLLDYWYHLRKQFQVWYDSLPVTFKPSSRMEPTLAPGRPLRGENEALFPEVWYNIPMCASTMQNYHMSQILLFMNKPHESTQGRSTVCARMNSYQSVLAACQKHSREIVGISLAQSDEVVRVYSIQALYTAGQCLADPRERQVVLGLIQDVEADTGYATEYRARQLTEQWQWEAQQAAFAS
ncbi:hypothetical protein OPT61_g2777 [Boeremia exigua]|uniref:Uncharacterized protein n=1 Tax=Boeremia exigua TaxID=749465 RepID=A0ACC2IKF0_9PLEO|nr:hypothetical protein OPT61_g2777 [Boeremia exigua]